MTSIQHLLAKALLAQKNKQYEKASALYQTILDQDPEQLEALQQCSFIYAQMNDIPNTIAYLNRVLAITPTNAQAHNNLARLYALQNQYQPALRHYRHAIHEQPDFLIAHYNLGLLLLNNNELLAAQKQLTNVITLDPSHINAHFNLGVLYLNNQQLDTAEKAFQTVLSLEEEHSFALTNLGVIALKREQKQLAIDYFTKALAFDPNNIEARNNLAATFIHHDRFDNALVHYEELLKQDANNCEYLYNSAVANMALGHLTQALLQFEKILTHNSTHFASLNNLAAIHIRLNERPKAIERLQRAIEVNPSDEACQFMLHALTRDEQQPNACPSYVNTLFNNYASYYDQHMQHTLHYNLPHTMIRMLHQLGFFQFQSSLDLGCGTGLTGSVLRDASAHLTGVDIAFKMLEQARNKNLYDDLVEMELVTFLQQNKTTYDLIAALDVLPYLGDLDAVFNGISHRLLLNGLFIFSCEINDYQSSWYLQENARFCHHPNYITTLCEQYCLKLIEQKKVVARQQDQHDVYVILYVAQYCKEK